MSTTTPDTALDTRFIAGLADDARRQVCDLLNARLADLLDLTLAVKQAHWALKGPGFIGVHELLDAVADRLRDSSDLVAERVVITGGQPRGTTQAVAETSQLEPYPTELVKLDDHLHALLERFNTVSGALRAAIESADDLDDDDAEDLFTEVSRQVDKDAWFIGANLPPAV
jgi:starvation-inducible DNA-binding protein